ncbi:hypothetical protein RHS01_04806 [Rhizoctonia solani]|uniref:Homeobox domain-containing protein n=1 Tax=Rhizoctonia solani TaxID=456999 RepID=A0A8H7IG55_9AGAM|nr:hypothetical protein RHS01_04806 [Rhizoctonia solani]
MSNTRDTPLASIQATLEHHIARTQGYLPNRLPATTPRFDAAALRFATKSPIVDYAKHISSLGFPAPLASDVTSAVIQESHQYQTFVEQVRLRLLTELSTTSVTPDASVIPSLVEAACSSFQRLLVDSGLEAIQKVASEASVDGNESDVHSDSEDDSSSSDGSDDDHQDGDEDIFDQVEEDDNTPMKPGEDVPPLETKYLPIFEALHERGKVLTKPEKTYLVNMTGMTYRQITIWFQNRRRGELKESTNMHTSSKASSSHSDDSSEFSEQEIEKNLRPYPSNTTFDIRSWRLQSALATKDDSQGSAPPFSPIKYNFPSIADCSDTQSDTDFSDDSSDDTLRKSTQSSTVFWSNTFVTSKEVIHSRPIRSIVASRRSSPSSHPQAQYQYSSSLNDQSSTTQYRSHQPGDTAYHPSQCVSSNENGLIISLDATYQLQTGTLRSPPVSISVVSASATTSNPSPPSLHPLQLLLDPHNDNDARPVPTSSSFGTVGSYDNSITTPTSSRPSVVLPPSMIPLEIEERLTAMAGRMGVGAASTFGSGAAPGISSSAPRARGTPGNDMLLNRSNSSPFRPTSLPRAVISLGVQPAIDQVTRNSARPSPSS